MRFFFYGSLLDAAIRSAVMGAGGRGCSVTAATLRGWRRCRRRDQIYPILRRDPRGSVEGCVVDGIDAVAAARLNAFEGSNYLAASVAVRRADGHEVDAFVFLPNRSIASPSLWHLAEWSRGRQRRALRHARQSMAASGRLASSGKKLLRWRRHARREQPRVSLLSL